MRLTTLRTPPWLAALLLAAALSARAAESTDGATRSSPEADKLWQQLQEQSALPEPPEAWRQAQPSPEEFERFRTREGGRIAKAAELAKDFQSRFPADPRADQAQTKEYELLRIAHQLGNTNVQIRLEAVEEVKLKDPKLTDEERFHIRASAVQRKSMAKMNESRQAAFQELETGARALIKDFPDRSEPYEMLQLVALEGDPVYGAKLAKELSEGSAPQQVKDAVKPLLRLGKPLSLKFTAVDGRAVDLEKLRGKVVLIDFWATWCGPCIRELPNVRAAYEKLKPKGFEIIGISFDDDKATLLQFVKDQKMPWPQYFDGKKWDNDFGRQFGIQSIPTMWLVDKKGNLRDLTAREELAEKVAKLLAE